MKSVNIREYPWAKHSRSGRVRLLLPLAVAAVFLLSAVLGGLGYFEFMPPEKTCVSCHEIRASHARWSNSVHRAVSCKQCHGGSADSLHALRENANRLFRHVADARHDDIRLSEKQTLRMIESCRQCHQREFAHWQAGGHGTNYAGIFMDETHNRVEQMADQCLLCHGMFFEGAMADLAAPLDTKGPWRFKRPQMAERPAIPCLACHELHAPGEPFSRSRSEREEESKRETNAPAAFFRRDTLAFYVRQEKAHFALDDLMVPKIVDQGRPVTVSSDPRQRLCTQCHAPDAFGNAGSGDDRTPTGVHEGLSCASCHAPHSNDTRGSCAQCHPARSSCGLDVTAMDTTYRSRASKNNIHRVKCLDCHPGGAPAKK
jgi:hypothetical protein